MDYYLIQEQAFKYINKPSTNISPDNNDIKYQEELEQLEELTKDGFEYEYVYTEYCDENNVPDRLLQTNKQLYKKGNKGKREQGVDGLSKRFFDFVDFSDLKELECIDGEELDLKIIDERNQQVVQISSDVVDINEIMMQLSVMVYEDGEKLDKVVDNIDESSYNVKKGVEELGKANDLVSKRRSLLRDIGIISGGVILGATGLVVGGPVIGLATLLLGASVSGTIVYGVRKHEKKHGSIVLRRKRVEIFNDKNKGNDGDNESIKSTESLRSEDENKTVGTSAEHKNDSKLIAILESKFPKTMTKLQLLKNKIM